MAPSPQAHRSLQARLLRLEAKQSRQKGGSKEIAGQLDLLDAPEMARGKRGGGSGLGRADVERAAAGGRLCAPVAILPCLSALRHCLRRGALLGALRQLRGDGRAYDQFPDRQGFRIYLDDLRKRDICERLALIFDAARVHELDPTRRSAKVTREISRNALPPSRKRWKVRSTRRRRLRPSSPARSSRCSPKMSACCRKSPSATCSPDARPRGKVRPDGLAALGCDERGDFAYAIEAKVKKFNGEFFKDQRVLTLGREEIGELRAGRQTPIGRKSNGHFRHAAGTGARSE